MKPATIVSAMKLEDKIKLCTGADFWHSKTMETYNIPAFTMSDGPHGLRCQKNQSDMLGMNDSLPATCFPTAVTAGATWNPALYAAEGEAIGREALAAGVDVVLGPGCNIKRDPLCGRNFEYLSEDPHLAGQMAAAFVKGQQATGVSSCLKHFAANNQEYKRQNGDSQVDDRALREIYLAPFETAVKQAQPDTIMCSYNKLNGIHASDNEWLLTQVLRDEWGFEGLVMTDWGAMNDRIQGFRAGCDLSMPGGSRYMEKATRAAVKNGDLAEADVEASAERIIQLAQKAAALPKGGTWDENAHDALACTVAQQGAVLLKNDDALLPLAPEDMVFIGYMARNFRYQGAGSSHINPTRLTSLTDALPQVPYCPCGDELGHVTDQELAAAAQAAQKARVAVVVAGLPDCYESEGFDRFSLAMPAGHDRMIEAVAQANPNTVVVLLGGSPMEIPWCDRVKAILYMGLSGQAGGRACADLLTGKVSPSGKLTESWPMGYEDVISRETFGQQNPEYRESIYVGYRYYDKAKIPLRYPFGHGLSYSQFAYDDLTVTQTQVTAAITNTGSVAADEVVQLYIAPPQGGLHRPIKELKGFCRVSLQPGERKTVTFPLDERSFALWDDGWKTPGGTYTICLGSSSQDIRLVAPVTVEGTDLAAPGWQRGSWYETMTGQPARTDWEKAMGHPVCQPPAPRKGTFTMDNSCQEMMESTWVMRLFYKQIEKTVAKGFGGSVDPNDPTFKMMMVCSADAPLRAMVITSGGVLTEPLAHGLLAMANGHYLRGLCALLKR
jgi:beta-glucosidase